MNNHYLSDLLSKAEFSWVKAESFKPLAEFAKRSMSPAMIMAVTLLLVMYPNVERGLWLAWLGLHVLSLLMWMAYIAYFKKEHVEKFKHYELISN